MTTNIYVTYAGAVPGSPPFPSNFVSGSLRYLNVVDYTTWRSALVATATDADDLAALNGSVPFAEPALFAGQNILLTNGNARALGRTPTTGVRADGVTPCSLGSAGCYDGQIAMSTIFPFYFRSGAQPANAFDFYTAIQHETDEILGTISSLDINQVGISPVDLFRYSAAGTRSFTPNQGPAHFSLDGGVTQVAPYNNFAGRDFGDWATFCQYVQDASLCPGLSLDINPSVEVRVLDVIGYNLAPTPVPVPEPKGMILVATVFGLFLLIDRRRVLSSKATNRAN